MMFVLQQSKYHLYSLSPISSAFLFQINKNIYININKLNDGSGGNDDDIGNSNIYIHVDL